MAKSISYELLNKFLSDKDGITMTSANHICNLAKEKAKEIIDKYESKGFVDISVTMGSSVSTPIQTVKGAMVADLDKLTTDLETVAKYHALIAWLREAIKVKSDNIEFLRRVKTSAILAGSEYLGSEINEVHEPKKENIYEEDSVTAIQKFLSIKELNEYYTLEARSAVIGKYIHPGNKFSEYREQMRKSLTNPNTIDYTETAITVTMTSPSLDPSVVENKFYELQRLHRESEARLNSLKQKAKLLAQDHNDSVEKKYDTEYEEYTKKLGEIRSRAMKMAEDEYRGVSGLKIIIPNDLKEIFDYINSL